MLMRLSRLVSITIIYWISHSAIVNFEPLANRYQIRAGEPARWTVGNGTVPAGVSKTSGRTPFESVLSPVVVHGSSMEHILDHVFSSLEIKGESVEHGVAMTECAANPVYARRELAEMLFEGYGVPKLAFCLDAPCALVANTTIIAKDVLILSVGNCATHILPVVDGKLVPSGIRKIGFGGAVASDYLLRLLQLKYPTFSLRMSPQQAQEAFHAACLLAPDYNATLSHVAEDPAAHDFTLQFPYTPTDLEAEAAKERDREALAAKRKEQAEALRERARLKREAKHEALKQHLAALEQLKDSLKPAVKEKKREEEDELMSEDIIAEEEDSDEVEDKILHHGYHSMAELDSSLEAARRSLKAFENKLAGVEEPREAPDYSLLDIPDEQLDAQGIQEKRRQRLMKSGAEARERLRKEKEEAERRLSEEKARDEQVRLSDFEGWRTAMYERRSKLIARMRAKKQRKEALTNRKSTASSARLRAVTALGMDTKPLAEEDETADTFGADDADWQIYRDIRSGPVDSLTGGDEEEAAEEAAQAALLAIEEQLEQFDESFYAVLAQELAQSRTILDKLKQSKLPSQEEEEAARFQLHMNVERYRVPEALFQPQAILGQDSAGLAEAIQHILSGFEPDVQTRLAANIFVTGGTAAIPGFLERLEAEMRSLRPAGEPVGIRFAQDLMMDAWKGLAILSASPNFPWIDRAWYDEHGGELLASTQWYTNPF